MKDKSDKSDGWQWIPSGEPDKDGNQLIVPVKGLEDAAKCLPKSKYERALQRIRSQECEPQDDGFRPLYGVIEIKRKNKRRASKDEQGERYTGAKTARG